MSIGADDCVWVFDGRGGVARMLADLVTGYLVSVQTLLPPSVLGQFPDPISALEADEGFDALSRIEGVRLERLFPRPVGADHDEEDAAWEGLVRSRAGVLHAHAGVVLADLEEHGRFIPVHERNVTAWLQTLGALRAALHADLVGSPEPTAEPTDEQVMENPALATVLDWLAYNLEDLLATREACHETGEPLDIDGIEERE